MARRSAISGGETVLPGAWPMVAWLDNGCSGVLLAPNVLVYAAHCGVDARVASFGDTLDITLDYDAGTASVGAAPDVALVPLSSCTAYPDWSFGTGTDIAFCLLDAAPIPASAIAPPIGDCDGGAVDIGSVVTLVGFGRDSASGAVGTKRSVRLPISAVTPELRVGDESAGTCAGDSGGPAFVALGDESHPNWRVAGILSAGISGDACGVSFYSPLTATLAWLEQRLGQPLSACALGAGSEHCPSAALDAQGRPSEAAALSDHCAPSSRSADSASGGCHVSGYPDPDTLPLASAALSALILIRRRPRTRRARADHA